MRYRFLVGWNGQPVGKVVDGSSLPADRIARLVERGIVEMVPEPEPEPVPVVAPKPKGKKASK